MLAPFVNELDKIAPSFKVNGSQIHIIQSPADFYETLKVCNRDPIPLPRRSLGYDRLLILTGKDTES